MARMKADIRQRWVDRLRAGTHKQRTGGLFRRGTAGSDSFCCLGVLCTIAEEDGIVTRDEWKDQSLLPAKVQEWAGIPTPNPIIEPSGGVTAADANDQGAKFPEIATAIARSM